MARQRSGSRGVAPKREGYHPGADLTRRPVIDAASAKGRNRRQYCLAPPDRPTQSRAAETGRIARMEEFGDGPKRPLMRALDDASISRSACCPWVSAAAPLTVQNCFPSSIGCERWPQVSRAGSVLFINLPGSRRPKLRCECWAPVVICLQAAARRTPFTKARCPQLVPGHRRSRRARLALKSPRPARAYSRNYPDIGIKQRAHPADPSRRYSKIKPGRARLFQLGLSPPATAAHPCRRKGR